MDIRINMSNGVFVLFLAYILIITVGSFSYGYSSGSPEIHGHGLGELSGLVFETPRIEDFFSLEKYCSSGNCGSTALPDGTVCPSCTASCENYLDCREKLSEQLSKGAEITKVNNAGPWGGNGITVTVDMPSKQTHSLTCSSSANCRDGSSYWDFEFSRDVKLHGFRVTYLK